MKSLLSAAVLMILLSVGAGAGNHPVDASSSPSYNPHQYLPTPYVDSSSSKASLASLTPGAVLSVIPETSVVESGEIFEVEIMLDSESQGVSGVQAFLDFDPTLLEVQDADPDRDGVQMNAGTTLPFVLVNRADNELGHIDYAAAQLGEPFPAGSFVLAAITFKAIDATPPKGTEVVFSTEGVRETLAELGGNPVLDAAVGATVVANPILSQVTLTVMTEVVESRQQVIANVVIDSAQDTNKVQFDLQFDSGVLRASSAIAGDLPGGTVFESDLNNDEGVVSVLVEAPESLGGEGVTLARVTFDLVGDAGESTDLLLAGVKVSDAGSRTIPHSLTNASVSVPEPVPATSPTSEALPSPAAASELIATPSPAVTTAPVTAAATASPEPVGIPSEETPQSPASAEEEDGGQTNLALIIVGALAGAAIIGFAALYIRRRTLFP